MKITYVRTGGGGPDQCVRTAYRGEGGGQKLTIFCVRTLWMAPYASKVTWEQTLTASYHSNCYKTEPENDHL